MRIPVIRHPEVIITTKDITKTTIILISTASLVISTKRHQQRFQGTFPVNDQPAAQMDKIHTEHSIDKPRVSETFNFTKHGRVPNYTSSDWNQNYDRHPQSEITTILKTTLVRVMKTGGEFLIVIKQTIIM